MLSLSQTTRYYYELLCSDLFVWEWKYRQAHKTSPTSLPNPQNLKRVTIQMIRESNATFKNLLQRMGIKGSRRFISPIQLLEQFGQMRLDKDALGCVYKLMTKHVWQQNGVYMKNRKEGVTVMQDGHPVALRLSKPGEVYGIALLQGIDSLSPRISRGLVSIKCYDNVQRECVYDKSFIPQVKPTSLVLVDIVNVKILHVYKAEEESLLVRIGEIGSDFIPNRNYRWPSINLVY
jgi:hypothetical protein